MATCQPDPCGAAYPRLLSTPAAAPPTYLPMEVVPSPQEATNAATPLFLPSPIGTLRLLPTPTAALSTSLPTEEVPTPQEASTVAPPPSPPPYRHPLAPASPTGPLLCCPASRWLLALCFAAQPAIGSWPSEHPTRLSSSLLGFALAYTLFWLFNAS